MKDFCKFLLVFAIMNVTIYGLLWFATSRPEVVFSWETKKCIEVNYMDGTKGDCNNLPEKYDHVWGK